jgi:DNA-binding transcriptional regulator YbjK
VILFADALSLDMRSTVMLQKTNNYQIMEWKYHLSKRCSKLNHQWQKWCWRFLVILEHWHDRHNSNQCLL